jgi:hypothetical protein
MKGKNKMMTKQISIYLENKPGQLAEICRALAKDDVNIAALSLADTAEFGIVRMIVDDHVKGCRILSDAGYPVVQTDVVVTTVPDRPGGMAELMERIDRAGVDIKYSYAYALGNAEKAILVFSFDNNEKGAAALSE